MKVESVSMLLRNLNVSENHTQTEREVHSNRNKPEADPKITEQNKTWRTDNDRHFREEANNGADEVVHRQFSKTFLTSTGCSMAVPIYCISFATSTKQRSSKSRYLTYTVCRTKLNFFHLSALNLIRQLKNRDFNVQ